MPIKTWCLVEWEGLIHLKVRQKVIPHLPLISTSNTNFGWPFCLFFSLRFTPCKAKEPVQGMHLQEKEAKKGIKHTENLFRKNLQLTGVC